MPCVLPMMMVAACAEPPVQRPAPVPIATRFEANGTEPFWSVTIENGRIRLERPDARPIVEVHQRVQHAHVHDIYRSRTMNVRIGNGPCSDGMSDRRYTHTVELRIGRQRLRGCGDTVVAPRALIGRSFDIASANNIVGVPGRAQIAFQAGTISGNGGCNRFTGRWRADGWRLVSQGVAMTRMACPGPRMAFEAAFGEAIAQPLSIVQDTGGGFRLVGGEGSVIVLRPATRARN